MQILPSDKSHSKIMLFNSFQFAVFFCIVATLYFTIPQRFRWVMLLAASYYFYMCWKVLYIFLIIGSTLICYFTALQMAKQPDQKRKKPYLWICLTANLGILFFYKYFNFFSQSANDIFKAWNILYSAPIFDVLLPVGISFYTFQALSYMIDVYNNRVQAERHLGIFALYVAFWPQLVAGPIERTHHLLPQFRTPHRFDYQRVTDGLRLMLWGLFKKVVIADHLATYVNQVYNHVDQYQGMPLIIATAFFSVQIYCDFSGYTDIARGAARIMGYDLMENFNRPYFSNSVREFWQRWHISLSTWFRDYVYIPLGGSRVAKWRWHYNLLLTFLLSGLWHGANWTFIIWGALHGCYLILENLTGTFQKKIAGRLFPDKRSYGNRLVQISMTLGLVGFAWIFFRANTVADAFSVAGKIFLIDWRDMGVEVVGLPSFMLSMLLILILFVVHLKERRMLIQYYLARQPMMIRWSVYMVAMWAVIVSGVFGVQQQFIYFQF
jgi:D-alanyl-lipoteichoic acid acyltransferase DltB (MBOAT superfamily)